MNYTSTAWLQLAQSLVRGPVTGKYGRFSNLQEQLHEEVLWLCKANVGET